MPVTSTPTLDGKTKRPVHSAIRVTWQVAGAPNAAINQDTPPYVANTANWLIPIDADSADANSPAPVTFEAAYAQGSDYTIDDSAAPTGAKLDIARRGVYYCVCTCLAGVLTADADLSFAVIDESDNVLIESDTDQPLDFRASGGAQEITIHGLITVTDLTTSLRVACAQTDATPTGTINLDRVDMVLVKLAETANVLDPNDG